MLWTDARASHVRVDVWVCVCVCGVRNGHEALQRRPPIEIRI